VGGFPSSVLDFSVSLQRTLQYLGYPPIQIGVLVEDVLGLTFAKARTMLNAEGAGVLTVAVAGR
jgi:hypothetical protein